MTALRKSISRRTNTALDGSFGRERNRRIVVTLHPGNGLDVPDTLEFRPERTRRREFITVASCYRLAIQGRLQKARLEKARKAKEKKSLQRASARVARADRKFRNQLEALGL